MQRQHCRSCQRYIVLDRLDMSGAPKRPKYSSPFCPHSPRLRSGMMQLLVTSENLQEKCRQESHPAQVNTHRWRDPL